MKADKIIHIIVRECLWPGNVLWNDINFGIGLIYNSSAVNSVNSILSVIEKDVLDCLINKQVLSLSPDGMAQHKLRRVCMKRSIGRLKWQDMTTTLLSAQITRFSVSIWYRNVMWIIKLIFIPSSVFLLFTIFLLFHLIPWGTKEGTERCVVHDSYMNTWLTEKVYVLQTHFVSRI